MAYYLVITLVLIELLYVAVLLYMYTVQRSILYQPENDIEHPNYYGLDTIEDHILHASDGLELGCWYADPRKKNGTVILYFHGNAGHIGDRVEKMHAFIEKGFGVCAPSYRGYGVSGGKPSEEGTYCDARAAIAFLHEKGFKDKQIILYGESLGSGIAVELAKEFPAIAMLVLEAPYTSTADRGMERYPFLPVYLVMKDHYDSLSKIPHIKAPVLIFHGEKDDIIPIHHGKRMYEAASQPKHAVFFKENDHTNFDPVILTDHIVSFAK